MTEILKILVAIEKLSQNFFEKNKRRTLSFCSKFISMAEEQINWKHTSNDSNAFKCTDSQIADTYTNMKRIRKPYTLNTVGGTYLSIDSSQTDTIRSKAIGNAIIFENMVLKFFKLTSSSLMSVSFRSIIWSTVDDHHPNNNDWESQVNLHFIPFSAAFKIIKKSNPLIQIMNACTPSVSE